MDTQDDVKDSQEPVEKVGTPLKFISVATIPEGEHIYALVVALGEDGCLYQRRASDISSEWHKYPDPPDFLDFR